MKWKKARKKPVIIEFREANGIESIKTREGTLRAYQGKDFIIKGIDGELYPIKKDIFYKTYEVLE